jgi:hypothetical protein
MRWRIAPVNARKFSAAGNANPKSSVFVSIAQTERKQSLTARTRNQPFYGRTTCFITAHGAAQPQSATISTRLFCADHLSNICIGLFGLAFADLRIEQSARKLVIGIGITRHGIVQ